MIAEILPLSVISIKWPNKPNPVTSVIEETEGNSANFSPMKFNWHILSVRISEKWALSKPRFIAVDNIPVPIGLVINIISPACAVLFFFILFLETIPFTANPNIGSLFSIEWPPAREIPARRQVSVAPFNTSVAIAIGNFELGQPRILNAKIGFPPIA